MVDGRRAEVSHARGRGAPSPGVEQPGRRVDDGEIRGRFASLFDETCGEVGAVDSTPMISQRYISSVSRVRNGPVHPGETTFPARPVEDESVSATHIQLQLNRKRSEHR